MEPDKTTQRMSVYFPLEVLQRVRTSAKVHRRSFNQEALWLIEQGLERQQKAEKTHDAQDVQI